MLPKKMWLSSLVLLVLQTLIFVAMQPFDKTAVGAALLTVVPVVLFLLVGRRNCIPAGLVAGMSAFGLVISSSLRSTGAHPLFTLMAFLVFLVLGATLSYRWLEQNKAPNDGFPVEAFVASLSAIGVVLMPILWIVDRKRQVRA